MSVLVTMRVKIEDCAGVKAAMAKYAALVQPAGDWDDVVGHLSDAAEVK